MVDCRTQTSSFMRTMLREDKEFKASHIKLKRPNIMTGALDVRKAPNIKTYAPNVKTKAPNIKTYVKHKLSVTNREEHRQSYKLTYPPS